MSDETADLIDLDAERQRRGWGPSVRAVLANTPTSLLKEMFHDIPEEARRLMMAVSIREYWRHRLSSDPAARRLWDELAASAARAPKQRRRRRKGWTPTLVACGSAGA